MTTTNPNTKISEVENKIPDNSKYIVTEELNKSSVENVTARLKQADIVNKIDFDNKLISFNKQITSNKTRHLEVRKKNKQTKNKKTKFLNSLMTNDFNFS